MIKDTVLGGLFLSIINMTVVFAVLFGLGVITKLLGLVVNGGGGGVKKAEPPVGRADEGVSVRLEGVGSGEVGEGRERVAAAIAGAIAAYEGGKGLGDVRVSGVFGLRQVRSDWLVLGRQRQIRAKAGRFSWV